MKKIRIITDNQYVLNVIKGHKNPYFKNVDLIKRLKALIKDHRHYKGSVRYGKVKSKSEYFHIQADQLAKFGANKEFNNF
jgi:ribonuclease HI